MKLKDLQLAVGRSDLRVHCMSITCFSAGAIGSGWCWFILYVRHHEKSEKSA